MTTHTYAVVDLETTGHSPSRGDRIIQIAIVLIEDGKITSKYTRFVNPGRAIPIFIQQLTSITEDDVKDAPLFDDIASEVSALLEGKVFIAHNTDFDLSFLQSEFTRCRVNKWSGKKIDTVELAKILFPTSPSYRLQDIAEELGISLPAAHRADDDAEATAHLFLACLNKLRKLPEMTLKLLHRRSFSLRSDISMLMYQALNESRDQQFPTQLAVFRGIPYRREETHSVFSKAAAKPFPYKDDKAKMELLGKVFHPVDKREAQFQFMDAVWDALESKQEIATEVPTGIGKTIGYLFPAAMYAAKKGKPVVISTGTNHLIDKMAVEDYDKISRMMEVDLRIAVLKGREHYISLGKLEELMRIIDESYDETFAIMQILVWLTETATGDLTELNVSGGGQLFLDRIRKQSSVLPQDEQTADFHNRMLASCPHADLIITNHSTLLSDSYRDKKAFQSIGGLIVDEAHQMIQIANHSNETVLSYTNWKYVIGQISSDAEGQLLFEVDRLHKRFGTFSQYTKDQLFELHDTFMHAFDDAIRLLTESPNEQPNSARSNRIVVPLATLHLASQPLARVAESMYQYYKFAASYPSALSAVQDQMTDKERAYLSEWAYWVRELAIKAGNWVEIFLDEKREDFAIWLEKDRRSIPGSLTVVKSPIDGSSHISQFISELKKEHVGLVWTSGTMSVQEDKRFVLRQLGIGETVPFMTFEAPPHFYDGANIFIVKDMPDIQQVAQSEYVEAVADAIVQTVMATGGRLFALFTSLDMLRQTYELILESELLSEYALIAQGVSSGSRMKLLKSFRQFEQSVLFGTNSFWEGVDVPGDALSAIIIVRLPFTSPDDPVFKARADKLTDLGINPFTGYALPEAIMRLRQGFGRLVRSSGERGFFIILDRRIETKSYGRRFLDSLPRVPVKKVSLERMVNELEDCYNE
ncbi:ATP-dependent helicase DinG [Sporosarcina sp. NCCP-2222]|uniref:ATP-dependent DNA helicase DinG n=1 Tax=Sporosarcina sp. NCCP-2222 TaxID=2935073 RepID=UPI00208CDFF0|nr:ATP-dependent DNA helicase DinG [Sporosarcina sp. NCCP-2222]GKV55411.1 ATP-dependent helicase DinG [Sporosarcina sp. NCCP-2222]